MYDVLDICRYVINYSNKKDYEISNLKLQKLLYFIQAYFLINNKLCFNEKIEAWDVGPIVPIAYNEYKQYGNTHIWSSDYYMDFNPSDPWKIKRIKFDENIINEIDKKLINKVIDKFADYTSTDLADIIYKQTPWKKIYIKNQHNEIPISLIKEYFNIL